jgi:acyl-CoA thioesterase
LATHSFANVTFACYGQHNGLEFRVYPPTSKNSGSDWFVYQVQTRQSADGYKHTQANIWDKHGTLVAINRQVVAVFA